MPRVDVGRETRVANAIAVQCTVCAVVTAHVGVVGDLTQVTCPSCGVQARLVQVPFGRQTRDGDKPGMPLVRAISP